MSYRPHVLTAIHKWDVFTFRRIVSRPMTCPLVRAARYVSRTGDGHIYPLVPLLALTVSMDRSKEFFILVLFAFTIERTIYLLAKNWFKRKRPANILPNYNSVIVASDEFSFPSGHSSAAFLMVTLLIIFYSPIFAVLYIWAAMVAISRIILGVHFPSDIVVGSAMGLTIAHVSGYLLL